MGANFIFKSKSDAKDCFIWMKKFLEDELEDSDKHEDPEALKEEIDKLFEDIEVLKNSVSNNDMEYDTECMKDIWSRIIMVNEDTYKHQREPEPISWGVWRIEKVQEYEHGYTNETLYRVYVPGNSDQKIHEYKRIPPIIKWKLNKIVQKDLVFYTASAMVEEIEQVSSVPALPKEMTSEEAGLRVLDSSRGKDEWQRRPIAKRIQSIESFVEVSENIIANAPILFVKNSRAVSLDENELVIDFNKFLIKETKTDPSHDIEIYVDHNKVSKKTDEDIDEIEYIDLRPIWLIDGQHRVRGLSRSSQGGRLTIPVIIFPSEFSLPRAAKIFAEINTLQVSLKPLHKLFMQHRFKISSPNSNRNFEHWEDNPSAHKDSRANHMSYELIAKLASRTDSALFNKVRVMEQNDSSDFYVKADQWVNYARSWFLHGPYAQIDTWGKHNEEDIYNEVNDYFRAFIETVNHTGWSDNKQRWPNTTRNKSLLQSSTHFKVLIDLFDEVYLRLKSKDSGIFNVEDFKQVLVPFKWVDWIDQGFKKMYGGGGERGRSSLYIWMYDALKSKESHPRRAVMSDNIKSIPGKGILAPPMKSEILKERSWPSPDNPVSFFSKRPYNARRKPIWAIEDNYSTYNNLLKIKNNEECVLHYEPFMDKIEYFKISVIWSNASSMDGTSHIRIINDK